MLGQRDKNKTIKLRVVAQMLPTLLYAENIRTYLERNRLMVAPFVNKFSGEIPLP